MSHGYLTNKIERSASTANPFTPRRCPPGEFASGKTVNHKQISLCYGMNWEICLTSRDRLTIANALASLARHMIVVQVDLSSWNPKPYELGIVH